MKRFLQAFGVLLSMVGLAFGGATFSRLTTWSNGNTLTASALNNEFDNILNNLVPSGMGSYSANATQMQTVTAPYPSGSESLATSLQGEIERMRYQLLQIKKSLQGGTTNINYWYQDLPPSTNFEIWTTSVIINVQTTFTAPVVMSTAEVQVIASTTGVPAITVNPTGSVNFSSQPAMHVGSGLGTAITIPSGTDFNPQFSTVTFDNTGMYNTAAASATVPAGGGGVYWVSGQIVMDTDVDLTLITIKIWQNATMIAFKTISGSGTSTQGVGIDRLVKLNAGDKIAMTVTQNSGSGRTITGDSTQAANFFEMEKRQ